MNARAAPRQTIGLLFGARADRKLLATFLEQVGHSVLAPEPGGSDHSELDRASLIIVDEPAAHDCADLLLKFKERVNPIVLPVMVALPATSDGTAWLKRGFDALLRMPLAKSDLLARIETLLRLRAQSEEALRVSEAFSRSALDAIAANVCVVDADGRITLANRAWREFAGANGALPASSCEGSSYLDACRSAALDANAAVRDAATAVLRVIEGDGGSCAVEYPCHAPAERRWFIASAVRFHSAAAPFTVISHTDISARRESELAARAAEQRFRSLVELSSDMYWETDREHRLVERTANDAVKDDFAYPPGEALGKARWDLPSVSPDPQGWAEHRATMDAHLPFRSFEFSRMRRDGSIRHASISGEPLFDERGGFTGYRGVGSNTTERKRAERLLRMEHAVTRSLADAESMAAGLQAMIRTVCEAKGWACGRYWQLDESCGVMRARESWSIADPAVENYLVRTSDMQVAPGHGVMGQVLQSGETAWVTDLASDVRAIHPQIIRDSGMHGACVVPVTAQGATLGVLAFMSQVVRKPDERLLEALRAIGSQLGQYLERKRGEENQLRFRAALDASGDAILLIDRTSLRYIDVNQTFCELVGYTREEVLRMTPMDLFSADRATLERDYDTLIAGKDKSAGKVEGWYRRKDGTRVAIETHRRVLQGKDGWIIVGSARDITQRIAQEQALRDGNERLAIQARRQARIARFGQFALKRRSGDELVAAAVEELADHGDIVTMFEQTAEGWITLRLATGEAAADSVGQSAPIAPDSAALRVLVGGQSVPISGEYLAAAPEDWPWSGWMRQMRSGVYVPVTHNGHAHGMLGIFSKSSDALGEQEVNFAASIGNMLSTALQRERAEQRLAFLAQFDSLTGLPNRSLLEDRLRQTVVQAKRKQRSAGVLFIDLDRFKLINDSLGHQAGDLMIREVANRLEQCLRPGDTVGRISGDEFVVVLADLAQADDAGTVAQKVLDALARPFDLAGNEAFVTASIGISLHPGDGEDTESLLRNADMAMYKAKKSDRNTFRYFTAKMNERTVAKLQLATDLRRAVDRREFALHYQPKVDLLSGAITGVEALLRWKHPERGPVSPAEFIPALESSGLILPVGEWVLEEACAQIRRWQAAGLHAVPVAVNLSVKQFRRRNLEGIIQQVLDAAGVPASMIELEITESGIADDPQDAVRQLENLRKSGLSIAIDDFGTGYSSLAYLSNMPLSALKIDRSFTMKMLDDPNTMTVVQTMISLAHSLRLKVIAEGVETEEQARMLRLLRCDQMQGYLFSKPLPPQEMAKLLMRAENAVAA